MTGSSAPWRIFAALALVPLIANWPVVSGWLTVDPIYTLSGLGTDLVAGPLPGTTGLDPSDGYETQALGRLAATQWLAGHIPWWNPFGGIGLPLPAEGPNPALFLPFVLLLALRNGALLVLLALQEVAAFSAYALLRQMALTRAASWIGAALFAVNGTFAWFSCGPMMPVAFLPMLLLGVEMEWRAVQRQPRLRSSRGWVVVAIAMAFALYAGFPETAYLDGLLGGAWALLRLMQCARGDRVGFALRIGAGAVTGLLLAAPFVVPFLHMLAVGDLGPHAADFSGVAAPPAVLPILLMPYVLGPQPFGVGDPSRVLLWGWNFLGGYVSLPVALLAVIAVAAPRAQSRVLRWLLAAWCAIMIATTFGVPGITKAVYSIPLLSRAMVFRYSVPSWELAAIVLAAMAIDDWQRTGIRRLHLCLAVASALAAVAVALAAASHSIAYLRANVPHYDPWMVTSVSGAVAITLMAAGLLAGRPAAWRTTTLTVLLLADGIALFSVPRLAGLRHAALDTAAVTFLKQHLGLQRFYSFGSLGPNYPAFFQVASLNSTYLPTPQIWSEYITSALDPWTIGNDFSGVFQLPGRPRPDHMAAFRLFLPAYRALGVRYVLVPAWERFEPTFRTPISAEDADALALTPGASLEATLPGASLMPGSIEAVSVVIGADRGPYRSAFSGPLSLTACAGDICRSGAGDLGSAADNAPLAIRLDGPLPVAEGQDLRLRLTRDSGTGKVNVRQYAQPPGKPRLPGLAIAVGLAPAASLETTFPSALLKAGSIESVSVVIGADRHSADGALALTACAGEVCRSGATDLASAADNAPIEIRLSEPLPIAAGQDLRLLFTHQGGTAKVAIWHYPQTSGANLLPDLAIRYSIAMLPLQRVYADQLMTIYELTDPAPYFETIGGPCRVSPIARETVTTECVSPARLIRRELFFDDWQATIDGRRAPILPADGILQAVDIPSGAARIEFHYAPPYAAASAAAFVVALVLLAAGAATPLPWRRRR